MNKNKILLAIALVFILCGIGWEIYKNKQEETKKEEDAYRRASLKVKRMNDSLEAIAAEAKKTEYTYMDSQVYKLEEEIKRFGSPKYNLLPRNEERPRNGIVPLEAEAYKGYYRFRDDRNIFKSADIQIKYFDNLNVVVVYCQGVSDAVIISEVKKYLDYAKSKLDAYNYPNENEALPYPEPDFSRLNKCLNHNYKAFQVYEAFDTHHGKNIVELFNTLIQVAETKNHKYYLNIYRNEAQ